MIKIGFWGGCFNPPSIAHIDLAKEMLKNLNLDKIVFVPVGDYYEKPNLENSKHRYNMLKIATSKIEKLDVEDIEINVNKKLYAKDAFEMLEEKYVGKEIYFVMGSDNYQKMNIWKEYDTIIKKYNYIVVQRPKFDVTVRENNVIYYKPEATKEISSTKIRELLKDKSKIDKYIDKDVYKYIIDNKLYNT